MATGRTQSTARRLTRKPDSVKAVIHRVDVAKALKLRLQGNTFEHIANVQGVTKQAIYQALTSFEPFLKGVEKGQLTAYSEERASLFNVIEQHLSASLLDPDAMQKASLNNRAYALKVIHEARRLETGQSTGNISVLAALIVKAEEGLGKAADNTNKPVTPRPLSVLQRDRPQPQDAGAVLDVQSTIPKEEGNPLLLDKGDPLC